MAFTSTDLSNVEAAIIELATGKRVVEVETAGKTRRFQAADMDKLIKLRNVISSDVQSSSNSSGFFNKVKFNSPS